MPFFVFFLILLLVWFFMLAPFFKLINISRQWKSSFTEAQKRAQQHQSANRNSQKQNSRKKKKIDPNIGEYVEFTETHTNNADSSSDGYDSSNNSGSKSAQRESQITDVSWEDLPNSSQR